MTTHRTPKTMPLNERLYSLLENKKGVFLGELHGRPSLVQSVRHLLPALKAKGVGTISVELPQSTVDDMAASQCTEAWFSNWQQEGKHSFTGGERTAKGYCDLVRAASALGITVLGHERPLPATLPTKKKKPSKEKADDSPSLHPLNFQPLDDPYKVPDLDAVLPGLGERGMNERNRLAASYINQHAVGKVIVLGGAFHSGKHPPVDDPRALRTEAKYKGLDALLGIPSLDMNWRDPVGPIGQSTKTDGRFNNFEVVLPEDLRSLNINSWPPPSGVPHIEGGVTPPTNATPSRRPNGR